MISFGQEEGRTSTEVRKGIVLHPAGGGGAPKLDGVCDREGFAAGISAASGDEGVLSGHIIPWFILSVVRCCHSNAMLLTK